MNARQGRNEPFFLYYNISPPHCPVAGAPEKYLTMYRPADLPIRPNADLSHVLENQETHFKVYRWDFRYYLLGLPHTLELPENYGIPQLYAEYYGTVTWMDEAVGRMLTALDRTGLAKNTIVVFISDHGDNLGSHGYVQKGGPNEESIRIPFITRWPEGLPHGRVIRKQVASLIDVYPSLLGLIDAPAPRHVHGRNLAPVMDGQADSLSEDFAIIETSKGITIRTPSHMYFIESSGDNHALANEPSFLFDVNNDLYQLKNLATLTKTELFRSLDDRIRRWNARIPWMD